MFSLFIPQNTIKSRLSRVYTFFEPIILAFEVILATGRNGSAFGVIIH
jgi:hypothetical protein